MPRYEKPIYKHGSTGRVKEIKQYLVYVIYYSIRRATYERLTELKTSLPLLFQDLTRGDPLYPLLQPGQIMKVAKRIRMLLSLADYCIELRDYQNVVREFL